MSRDKFLAFFGVDKLEDEVHRAHQIGGDSVVCAKLELDMMENDDDDAEAEEDEDENENEETPLKSMAEYMMDGTDPQDIKFAQQIQSITRLPRYSMKDVFDVLGSLESGKRPAWLGASINTAVANGLNISAVPIYSRQYLSTFWREPHPERPWERPCKRAETGECESHRLSGGAFVCMEFLNLSDYTRLMGVAESKRAMRLPTIHGWCVFCHYREPNLEYLKQLDKIRDRRDETPRIERIHHFGVQVEVEGEYRLDKTLTGTTIAMGLYAPFPIYNANNYWVVPNYQRTGLRGICESDAWVFQ